MNRRHVVPGAIAALALGAIALALVKQVPAASARERTTATAYWRARARHAEQHLRDARAGLHLAQVAARDARLVAASRPSSVEAIRLARVTFPIPFSRRWARAACEPGPGPHAATPQPADSAVDPTARNPVPESGSGEHAVGLFQFLPSTFARTPYAGMSITSPYASSLAAAWMEANGHGGEWACTGSTR